MMKNFLNTFVWSAAIRENSRLRERDVALAGFLAGISAL
jgi:hypothetical protein